MTEYIPVHIGLMGHIDHGKTELARALSEKVSTAGLDRHPQARRRGITIDLGFTMFRLGKYLITLVDAPGHADLIRSVVASATIIDAAILVVAADEGPKVQTGEHIVVLQSMGIQDLVVVITKTDLADADRLDRVEQQIRTVLQGTPFQNAPVVRVSPIAGLGIEELKNTLLQIIRPRHRDVDAPLLIPLDHAFPVRGHGTVVTGTILRGVIHQNDVIRLVPQDITSRVRSIQIFGETIKDAHAGDRVGINLPEVDHRLIMRGSYICREACPSVTTAALVHLDVNPFYRARVTYRMLVMAMIGMPSTTAELVPYEQHEEYRIVLREPTDQSFDAALLFSQAIPVDIGMRVLLLRTDLPPTSMRIVASGEVVELTDTVSLFVRKDRVGRVSRIRESDVLIEGLAHSKERAARLCGQRVMTRSGISGDLLQPFGTRGIIIARFEDAVNIDDEIVLERLKKEEFRFGR